MGIDDAFDKARWHDGSVHDEGLPEEQSFVHTGLFVAWCALNGLWDPEHSDEEVLRAMRERTASPIALYEWNNGCFFPFMLTKEGREFAHTYFDFVMGEYLKDYATTLALGLPSTYRVPNTWESYDRVAPVIETRYRAFKA